MISDRWSNQRDVGRGLVKHLDTPPQASLQMNIVHAPPFEEFPARQFEHAIVVAAGADVGCVPIIPNSVILGGVPAADFFGGVRGSVIRNDEFKVGVILPYKRVPTRTGGNPLRCKPGRRCSVWN